MILKSIKLSNFRNFTKTKIDLSPLTVIIGKNGSGKTNFTEAIRLVSIIKSFKAKRQLEMIRFGAEVARVEVVLKQKKIISVSVSENQKLVKVDGKAVPSSQAVGLLPTVLFTPDDTDLLSGRPLLRRRFIDALLSQSSGTYTKSLIRLGHILKQRNKLLVNIKIGRSKVEELQVWDEVLALESARIEKVRRNLMKYISLKLSEIVAGFNFSGKVSIHPHFSVADVRTLEQNRQRDVRLVSTTVGPHHDDFSISLAGKDVGRYGSRGQQRSVIIALKEIELEYLKEKNGTDPLLILDDVFSELDRTRRQALTEIISRQQTVITAITSRNLPRNIKGKLIYLKNLI